MCGCELGARGCRVGFVAGKRLVGGGTFGAQLDGERVNVRRQVGVAVGVFVELCVLCVCGFSGGKEKIKKERTQHNTTNEREREKVESESNEHLG